MDTTKIMTALCAFILLVCLVLCITTLIILRNAVEEHRAIQTGAQTLVEELDRSLDEWSEKIEQDDASPPNTEEIPTEGNALSDTIYLRTTGNKIGVFTKEGSLIRVLEVNPNTLPKRERDALREGIEIHSWEELLSLIRDYMG